MFESHYIRPIYEDSIKVFLRSKSKNNACICYKIKLIFNKLVPPDKWKIPVLLTLGVLTGLAFLTFHIANGTSYMSDKPETCINCHVMFPQYSSWQHSSHARVATCNDCHVPQDNFIRKYLFKATDGLRHSTMFTFRLEPQVIRIKDAGRNVVQENCRSEEHTSELQSQR